MSDRIYSAEQITVPPELPEILKNYSKEVIRHNPADIIDFSKEYFIALSKGELEQFLNSFEAQKASNRKE